MSTGKNIYEKLASIQKAIICPKDLRNEFADFDYRSCEGILKAVKPLLDGMILILTDEIVEIGGRIYIKATANLDAGESGSLFAIGYAREELTKKGMDTAQITGSTSSYARKYALAGLFLVDDGADPDRQNNTQHETQTGNKTEKAAQTVTPPGLQVITSITQKSGKKKNGEDWTRYKVTDGNKTEYSTFSKTIADIAKIAMEKKACVLFEHEEDQYKTLKLIEIVDQTTGEASDELPPPIDEDGNPA